MFCKTILACTTIATLGTGLIGINGALAAGNNPAGFNGTWSVQLMTDSGICGSRSQAIAIENGRVRAVGSTSMTLAGQISASGLVSLSIYHSLATGGASGRLQANFGSGTWRASTVGCSGRWTAQRLA